MLEIHTDGGSRGNPGPAASAFVVSSSGQTLHEEHHFLGVTTNNQAEYQAVVMAIDWLAAHHPESAGIYFFMDSLLVVNQLKGLYKIKDPGLQIKAIHIHSVIKSHSAWKITFTHIPRAQNSRADFLVNQALDHQLLGK
jgi:ribonuclease HI